MCGKLDSPVQINTEDYEHLLDDYSHFVPPAEGEILEGRVLKVTATEVIVDFGSKSEGLVPIDQFRDQMRSRARHGRGRAGIERQAA